jgi:hypothetical protein
MPFPYLATNVPFCKRPLKAMAGSWQGDGMLTAGLWHIVGMSATCQLMAFAATTPSSKKFVIRSIPISDCSGQVASVKQRGVCDGRGEAYYLGART